VSRGRPRERDRERDVLCEWSSDLIYYTTLFWFKHKLCINGPSVKCTTCRSFSVFFTALSFLTTDGLSSDVVVSQWFSSVGNSAVKPLVVSYSQGVGVCVCVCDCVCVTLCVCV